jgi:hypothetical protein
VAGVRHNAQSLEEVLDVLQPAPAALLLLNDIPGVSLLTEAPGEIVAQEMGMMVVCLNARSLSLNLRVGRSPFEVLHDAGRVLRLQTHLRLGVNGLQSVLPECGECAMCLRG